MWMVTKWVNFSHVLFFHYYLVIIQLKAGLALGNKNKITELELLDYKMTSYISTFVSYLVGSSDNAANKTQTENGAWVMDTSNHPGVDAFHKIVRVPTTKESGWRKEPAESRESIRKHINGLLDTSSARWQETHNPATLEYLVDAFLLAAHKRAVKRTSPDSQSANDSSAANNTNGGEGERMIFARMMVELYKSYPETVSRLIPLIPQLGSWQDLYMIWSLAVSDNDTASANIAVPIIKCLVKQLMSDAVKLDDPEQHKDISLCAKWVAREGSYWDKLCYFKNLRSAQNAEIYSFTALAGMYHLAKQNGFNDVDSLTGVDNIAMFCDCNGISWIKKTFRKIVSRLCATIDVFEQKACSGRWSEIAPGKVPSRAMAKYSKAFLNEKLKEPPIKEQLETGNRYPDNKDRVKARANMIKNMAESKNFKTDGLDPHEIIKKYQATKSITERELILKQWLAKVDAIYDEIMSVGASETANPDTPVELGYDSFDGVVEKPTNRKAVLVPMMDVSGSMSGTPMEVSVGLGVFLTYLQEKMGVPPFAVSFTEQPRAFDFTGMSLEERLAEVNSNVGYNTNFWSAIELVLQAMVRTGREMDLIVFTDMQWDQAETRGERNPAATMHQRILAKVADLGLKSAPRIIYWNLRANTPGVQTTKEQEGVQFLQGYSASLLRFALLGEDMPEKVITLDDGTQIKVKSITPYETYRKALDSPRYAAWRQVVMSSSEGLLAHLPKQEATQQINNNI
jgi:hypothetical protein